MFQKQLCFPSHCFKHPLSYQCLHHLLHFHHKDNYWTDILTIRQSNWTCCLCRWSLIIQMIVSSDIKKLKVMLLVFSLSLNVQYCFFSWVCFWPFTWHYSLDCITKFKTVSYHQKSSMHSNQSSTVEKTLLHVHSLHAIRNRAECPEPANGKGSVYFRETACWLRRASSDGATTHQWLNSGVLGGNERL